MKQKIDSIDAAVIILTIAALSIYFAACNPVKQVLRDKQKLDKVAEVVIRSGYCANDTTFIISSDTIVSVDTLIHNDTTLDVRVYNDTTFVTRWRTREIVRNITVHDTLKSVIVDNARLNVLSKDLDKANAMVEHYKDVSASRMRWIVGLLFIITLYIVVRNYLKPFNI